MEKRKAPQNDLLSIDKFHTPRPRLLTIGRKIPVCQLNPFGHPGGASRIDEHCGVVHTRRIVFRRRLVVFQHVRKFVNAFSGRGVQMKTLFDERKELLEWKWEVIANVTRDNLGDSGTLAHLHQSRHQGVKTDDYFASCSRSADAPIRGLCRAGCWALQLRQLEKLRTCPPPSGPDWA